MSRHLSLLLSWIVVGCTANGQSPPAASTPSGTSSTAPASAAPQASTPNVRLSQSGKSLDLPSGSKVSVVYQNDNGLKYHYDGEGSASVSKITLTATGSDGSQLIALDIGINRDSQKLFKEIKGKPWSPNAYVKISADPDAYKRLGKDTSGFFPVSGSATLPITLESGASPFKGKLTYQITTLEFDLPDSAITR